MAYYPEVQDAPVEEVPTWRCHHCGATGSDAPGINEATHVIASGDEEEERTYLRPHCGSCLSPPPGNQDLAALEWRNYSTTSAARTGALRVAADEGRIADARIAFRYQCTICGTGNVEDLVGRNPVYAVVTDRDEAACIPCVESHTETELAEADRRRAAGALARWPS